MEVSWSALGRVLLLAGLSGMLLLAAGCSRPSANAPGATAPSLAEVSLARIAGDPLPVEVIEGRLEDVFEPVQGAFVRQPPGQTGWWRVRVRGDIAAAAAPQLVLLSPHLTSAEVWLPGQVLPSRYEAAGPVGGSQSPRALVVPLPAGLRAGDAVYLRVRSPLGHPMQVRIAPLAAVHHADLVHVAWRSAGLAGLLLLAMLALGMWAAVRQSTFGLLAVSLLAQAAYFATSGGEARLLQTTEWLVRDARLVHLSGLLALLASMLFAGHYLSLGTRRPRVVPVLRFLAAATCVLALLVLVTAGSWLVIATSTVAAAMALTVLLAAINEGMHRSRPALFLLVAWLPVAMLLLAHLAALNGLWTGPPWLAYALPASCVLSGLVVMIGLGDVLRKLRRERDAASRQASYDLLTGGLSRSAIETRLAEAVRAARVSGRPLSVAFFDIDHFKQVNDAHGHLVGDQCIRIIALRTRNRLRTYDLFGRWGGDELLVLLPDTTLDEAVGVAENLRSAVNCRGLEIDGRLLDASVSVGVAELSYGEVADELVRRADAALYASKQAGRDRVSVSRWATLQEGRVEISGPGVPVPATDRS